MLSDKMKKLIRLALPNKKEVEDVVTKLDGASAVAAVATADATDLASAIALANANKAKINEVIAALKASKQMKS